MNDTEIILKILEEREKRYQIIKQLLTKSNCSIAVLTLNIPGQNKNPEWSAGLHNKAIKYFSKKVDLVKNKKSTFFRKSFAGLEWFCAINYNAEELKKICVLTEEELPMGRILDFDVYDSKGKIISRTDLNIPARRCLICNEPAHLCARSKKHNESELIKAIKNIK